MNYAKAKDYKWIEPTATLPVSESERPLPVPELKLSRDAIVFDVECTMKGPKKDPSPWWPENKAVMVGWYYLPVEGVSPCPSAGYHQGTLTEFKDFLREMRLYDCVSRGERGQGSAILIGHNLKFDLNWLDITFAEDVSFWDTQVYEYLRTGQRDSFVSLDDLALNIFGEGKDSTVKLLWNKGLDTDEIDKDILAHYLHRDVMLTLGAFHYQKADYALSSEVFRKIVDNQMHLVNTLSVIERNGWTIDKEYVEKQREVAQSKAMKLLEGLEYLIAKETDYPKDDPKVRGWNLLSNRGLSHVFFGFPYCKYEYQAYVGMTKAGNKKYKWKTALRPFCGLVAPPVRDLWFRGQRPNETLGYSVSDTILDKIIGHYPAENIACVIAKGVRALRRHAKLLNTYWDPTLESMQNAEVCKVYPTYNQTLTGTGRLSSSKPNGQNMPPVVKKMVKSQFDEGLIIELDFKQLEMVGLAIVSECDVLLTDIACGKDVHTKTGSVVYGHTMSKEERRVVKGVNFGLIYGGSARTLSEQTGVEEATVKKLIESFYTTYPRVREWQKEVFEFCVDQLIPDGTLPAVGGMLPKSMVYHSPQGRRYYFKEKPSPEFMKARGTHLSLSPTLTKNYPVQGYATGDIVPYFLNAFYERVTSSAFTVFNSIHIIGTVHDSIVLDVSPKVLSSTLLHDMINESLEETVNWVSEGLGMSEAAAIKKCLRIEMTSDTRWG